MKIINNTITPKILNKQQNSVCASNKPVRNLPCNNKALQSQLAFMGLVNQVQVHKSEEIGENIFQTCIKKLEKFRVPSTDLMMMVKRFTITSHWILLDKPRPLDEAIDVMENFRENIYGAYPRACTIHFCLDKEHNIGKIKKEIINGKLPNLKVRGNIGSGLNNTAFLTDDYKVIKFGNQKNSPSSEEFIEGLHLPAIDEFKSNDVHGVLNPFTENGELHFLNDEDCFREYGDDGYLEVRKSFNRRLLDYNQRTGNKYLFEDFPEQDRRGARQMGFIGKDSFLIDSGCLKTRKMF